MDFQLDFFWIAYTYEKLGEINNSLDFINKGLNIDPENLFMLDFKTNLLAFNFDKNDYLKNTAITFFEYRLELDNHFKSLYYLIKAKKNINKETILTLLKKHTQIINFVNLSTFTKCKLNLFDLLNFLINYDKYLTLRQTYPLNRYLDHLISQEYSISIEFYDIMDLIFAKAFNEAIEEYYTTENIQLAGKKTLEIISFLPNAIFELIPDTEYTQEESIAIMSHIYLEYPNIAVREFGVQMGLISKNFGLEKINPEDILTEAWYDEFRENTLIYTNQRLKLLKEE